jgi:hypothetical protein
MQPKPNAAQVNLASINPLAEVVLRAGDLSDPAQARKTLQKAYQLDDDYDNVIGISVLFKVGANADFLAQEGGFRHNRISITVVAKLIEELATIALNWYFSSRRCLNPHSCCRIIIH